MIKSKRVLVTGGTGFVGSHLVSTLISQGIYVVTTQQSQDPFSLFVSKSLYQRAVVEHCDVKNFAHLFDIITKHGIDTIFHLAAQPLVDVAYYNPKETIETNILGTLNVLEAARLHTSIQAVVVASSDKAYGKNKAKKYTEADSLAGDHPYEVSKSAADLLCTTYAHTYNVPVTVSRFGNIYGEGDLNFSRIIPGIAQAAITGKKLLIRSDGTLVRDYLYVGDVVKGYLLLGENIEKTKGQAYNFGSSETYSVLKLIKHIEKHLGMTIPYKVLNTAHNEIPYQSLDYSKATAELKWEPTTNIADVIRSILQWYRGIISLIG